MEQFKSLVRPIITLAFAGAFIYMSVMGTISNDAFLGLATLVVKFWFDSRQEEKKP
jgi:hypothetical protein